MKVTPVSADFLIKTALVLAAAGGAVYVVYRVKQSIANLPPLGDMAAGVWSGNNAITESARTDAYQGAGVLGTLGAAADNVSGGTLSRFGEWLGGKAYDWTH